MITISVNVNSEKEEFIIERMSSKINVVNENTICKNCIFYSGIKCHGHGDFWGTCSVYKKIIPNSSCYDNIVYDYSNCKVFSFLNSLNTNRKVVN